MRGEATRHQHGFTFQVGSDDEDELVIECEQRFQHSKKLLTAKVG